MKSTYRTIALSLLAAALGLACAGLPAAAQAQFSSFTTPETSLRQAKAQKTATALRTASTQLRSSLYGSLSARGGRIAYAELPLATALSALSDTNDAQNRIELEFLKRDGDPVAVLYASDDDDDLDTVYSGYQISNGASITRTGSQLEGSRSSYLIVDSDSEAKLSDLVAEANAQIGQQLAQLRLSGALKQGQSGLVPAQQPSILDALGTPVPTAELAASMATKTWLLSVLHSIRADTEVKASGDAEIYAMIVGLSYEGEPLMEVVQMPYFDRRYTTYIPEQTLVQWGIRQGNGTVDWSRAPWFEMIVMEYDRKESFQEVVQIALDEIGKVAVAAGGNPVIGMAGSAASAIVGAIPEYVFKGEDDYLDSFHMLVHGERFLGRGAANNIHIDLMPEEITFNAADIFADLSVKGFVASGGSYYPHQKVYSAIAVENLGELPSQGWTANFYLVPMAGSSPKIFLAKGQAGSLGSGQLFNQHMNLPLDAPGVVPGTYRLRVEIQSDGDAVAGNNARVTTSVAPITVKAPIVPGDDLIWAKPDLKAGYIVGVAGDYDTDDEVQTWFGFDNNGGGSGDFDVHFWGVHQSTGRVSYLAKGASGGIAGGGSYGGIVDLPLTGLAPGQYKLVMQIAGVQGEAWTNNNIVPSQGTITVRPNLTGELGQ